MQFGESLSSKKLGLVLGWEASLFLYHLALFNSDNYMQLLLFVSMFIC